VHLDLATINKTRSSRARVNVLVNLKRDFPKSVRVDIINKAIGDTRTEVIQIRYDYVPKYCEECIMQGHNKEECRIGNIQKGGGKERKLLLVKRL